MGSPVGSGLCLSFVSIFRLDFLFAEARLGLLGMSLIVEESIELKPDHHQNLYQNLQRNQKNTSRDFEPVKVLFGKCVSIRHVIVRNAFVNRNSKQISLKLCVFLLDLFIGPAELLYSLLPFFSFNSLWLPCWHPRESWRPVQTQS